jgi:hypothetical protein
MAEDTHKPRRDRSPSYPGLPLEQAIDKARVLYEKERKNSVPVQTVLLKHWGYKSVTTGAATVALAAVKKFGLIVDEGSGASRRVRLTDLALKILLNPDDQARRAAVVEAAMTPPIHAELWKTYSGDLPSDDSLHYELVVNRNFTETGAKEFIAQFRATTSYAGIDSADMFLLGNESNRSEDADDDDGDAYHANRLRTDLGRVFKDPEYKPKDPAVTSIPVLLPGAQSVTIEGRFPISEAAWTQLLAVLNAMKPGLVREPDEPDEH